MKKYQEIRGFDYRSMAEFEGHKRHMETLGWKLIKGLFCGILDPHEVDDDEIVYTANYIKSPYL
jgi:hypothetical protein